jgi:hypothetical protein
MSWKRRDPSSFTTRKPTLFWRYQLPMGRHEVRFRVLNPSPTGEIRLNDAIIYSSEPPNPRY